MKTLRHLIPILFFSLASLAGAQCKGQCEHHQVKQKCDSTCTLTHGQTAQQTKAESVAMPTVQVDTIKVFSTKMNRDITTVVTVPKQYLDKDDNQRWPVLYLLHGAWGSYRDWPTKTHLDELATKYGMIIVCPDGQDSWYWDSPERPNMQFETFISSELVAYIDKNYYTLTTRDQRAITGLSMGGQGALWNAWRHPDVFGSCGSMSGAVNITHFPDKWKVDTLIGKFAAHRKRWTDHAIVNLVNTIEPGQFNIIIDDGNSDIFIKENNELHQALQKKNIQHDFAIRPGGHSWTYWVNSLPYHLEFFAKAFAAGKAQ